MFIKKDRLIARIKSKIAKAEKQIADHEKKFPAYRTARVASYKKLATAVAKTKTNEEARRLIEDWPHPKTPYLDYNIERNLKMHQKQLAILESIVEEDIEVGRFTSKMGLEGMFDD